MPGNLTESELEVLDIARKAIEECICSEEDRQRWRGTLRNIQVKLESAMSAKEIALKVQSRIYQYAMQNPAGGRARRMLMALFDEVAELHLTLESHNEAQGGTMNEEIAVRVDKEGVHFGKWFWVSHETITGCIAEKIPEKQKQYYEWWKTMILLQQSVEQQNADESNSAPRSGGQYSNPSLSKESPAGGRCEGADQHLNSAGHEQAEAHPPCTGASSPALAECRSSSQPCNQCDPSFGCFDGSAPCCKRTAYTAEPSPGELTRDALEMYSASLSKTDAVKQVDFPAAILRGMVAMALRSLDLQEALARAQNSSQRDGEWIDEMGCCKLCDGEIPYGHDESCHLRKLEQKVQRAESALAERTRERDEARAELEQTRVVASLAGELCDAVDLAAEDIGGCRRPSEILAELGPAVDAMNAARAKEEPRDGR